MAAGIVIPVEAGDKNTRTEGSRMYAIIVCIFASLAGLFFGYDQGVTGGVLVMDGFIDDFCVGFSGNTVEECHRSSTKLPGNWRTFTTLYNVMYYLGCAIGAALGGWIADKYGRRATIFNAGVWFCVGTIWICANPANQHTLIIFGRIVQGVGVGNSSFSVPIYGAEMAPKELRGLLSGFMQMTVVTGILVANCVNIGIKNYRHGWRITNGVSIAPPVIVMIGIFCIPESPRWMYQHKGREAAETTLKKLRMTENVGEELDAIGEQLELEGSSSWLELWDPSLRRRALIAMFLQVLQQATGINPVFSYGALIYKDVVGDGTMSLLILAIVNFVSTIPAMRWVDSFGRRTLLLIGAVGMCLGHLVAAISFVAGCNGNTDNAGCNDTAGYIMIVASCFFVFNFAISWGPVCWIYPAEIFPLNVRAKAVSLSTMANWGMGAVMVAVVKLFPTLNIDGVFFLFFGTCTLCGVFVWFFCPETKGILLEDIEALFHGRATRKGVSPKYVEASTPNANIA